MGTGCFTPLPPPPLRATVQARRPGEPEALSPRFAALQGRLAPLLAWFPILDHAEGTDMTQVVFSVTKSSLRTRRLLRS
jgi:hypothetical protein